MVPAAAQWEWSCNTRRRWVQALSFSRRLPFTGARSQRLCCLRNIWFQVRKDRGTEGNVPTAACWESCLSCLTLLVFVCQCVQTTTTFELGRWPVSEGWSPLSQAPLRSPPSKYYPWKRQKATAATALETISVKHSAVGTAAARFIKKRWTYQRGN